MTNTPPNSPIDLRALVLYHIHQKKTAEKSYGNYEKLSELLGEEAISEENYEYWFNRYPEEARSTARFKNLLPFNYRGFQLPDIRGCILSDVIDGKPAEKSFNDLCEAFKNVRIDKEDHVYWFKRFENGKLFTRVTLSNLPNETIAAIIENCDDFKSFLNLRKVSRRFRNIIDYLKPLYREISIQNQHDEIFVNWDNKYGVLYTNQDCEYDPSSKIYVCKYHDYTNIACNDLKIALGNPKLQLDVLNIQIHNNGPKNKEKMIRDLFNSLENKIHVEHCDIRSENEEDVISVLSCIKPGTLEKLTLSGRNSYLNISRLVELEQWKQAKHVKIYVMGQSVEHFFHFTTFQVEFDSISIDDIVRLVDALSKSTNFKSCAIQSRVAPSIETIKQVLNLQLLPNPRYTYSIPNTNIVFFNFYRGEFKIYRI